MRNGKVIAVGDFFYTLMNHTIQSAAVRSYRNLLRENNGLVIVDGNNSSLVLT